MNFKSVEKTDMFVNFIYLYMIKNIEKEIFKTGMWIFYKIMNAIRVNEFYSKHD